MVMHSWAKNPLIRNPQQNYLTFMYEKVKEGAPVVSSHFVCTCKLFILCEHVNLRQLFILCEQDVNLRHVYMCERVIITSACTQHTCYVCMYCTCDWL